MQGVLQHTTNSVEAAVPAASDHEPPSRRPLQRKMVCRSTPYNWRRSYKTSVATRAVVRLGASSCAGASKGWDVLGA
jgi:hypothetical protein